MRFWAARSHCRGGWARARFAAALPLLLIAVLTGCNGGVRWQGPTFHDAHAVARSANELTFVYFRSWYLVECTDFEENVLKNPEVLAETHGMVCVPLDFDWDQLLAQRWGLKAVPAYVVVAPSGVVMARGQAPITRGDLLAAMQRAKTNFASRSQPVETAPAMPR